MSPARTVSGRYQAYGPPQPPAEPPPTTVTDTIYLSAYVMFDAQWLNTAAGEFNNEDFLEVWDAGDGKSQGIFFNGIGNINIDWGTVYTFGFTPDPGDWHRYEIKAVITGAGGLLTSARLDGTPVLTDDADDGSSAHTWVSPWHRLRVGATFGSGVGASAAYYDGVELAVDDWLSSGGTPIFSADFESGLIVPPFDLVGGDNIVEVVTDPGATHGQVMKANSDDAAHEAYADKVL